MRGAGARVRARACVVDCDCARARSTTTLSEKRRNAPVKPRFGLTTKSTPSNRMMTGSTGASDRATRRKSTRRGVITSPGESLTVGLLHDDCAARGVRPLHPQPHRERFHPVLRVFHPQPLRRRRAARPRPRGRPRPTPGSSDSDIVFGTAACSVNDRSGRRAGVGVRRGGRTSRTGPSGRVSCTRRRRRRPPSFSYAVNDPGGGGGAGRGRGRREAADVQRRHRIYRRRRRAAPEARRPCPS